MRRANAVMTETAGALIESYNFQKSALRRLEHEYLLADQLDFETEHSIFSQRKLCKELHRQILVLQNFITASEQ